MKTGAPEVPPLVFVTRRVQADLRLSGNAITMAGAITAMTRKIMVVAIRRCTFVAMATGYGSNCSHSIIRAIGEMVYRRAVYP